MDNLERDLKFDKYRISIGLVPIENYPYYSFSYAIADNYDWILEKNSHQQYFIPVFRRLGLLNDIILVREQTVRKNRICDRKIPLEFRNKFMIGETKFPSFFGYFSNKRYANREWQKVKDFILTSVFKYERIFDAKPLQQSIEQFNLLKTLN